MVIEVYADGSATVKTKPGGYGWVICIDNKFHSEGSGHLDFATNNDAELLAAIRGLEAALDIVVKNPSSFPIELDVTLKSDSELILGWANGSYNFKQADKMAAYEILRRLMKKLHAKTQWIRGHSGDTWNERCDELANAARLGIEKEIKKEEIKATGIGTLIGNKKDGVLCVWYGDQLKVISLTDNVIEDYNRETHGKRGSAIEIRKERLR